MTDIPRPAVTVLSGFSPAATGAVARRLLVDDPSLLLVVHSIDDLADGTVRRLVRTAAGIVEDVTVELVHGCFSCTLRDDVLPTLVRLAHERPGSDLLLALPRAVEPEAVAAACAHSPWVAEAVRFDSYVTVVDAGRITGDLDTTDDLRDRGLHVAPDDHRAVADVVARQLEYADTILTWTPPDTDPLDRVRTATLLRRLVPWAVPVDADTGDLPAAIRRTHRHDPRLPATLGRALAGYPIGDQAPTGDWGVASLVFEARRPFHPQRLHDALEDLAGLTLRARGQLWIASQPDTVLGFEAAGGGIGLGGLGYWLAALPPARWTEASLDRRLTADATWDPYYGDRRTTLAFVGLDLASDALTTLLTHCLLTDDELADGHDTWPTLPDPFAGCFTHPETTDAPA
ncbi:GTP-binding protein [Cryptosporangium arvum]|uniref:Putative GTPase, G3E family n=1 Tax=Cryptosporangium arvum DSM 44712 TaxID=927661 RepID=A0A010ZZE0_9ACTN|nr:GTP-binding protein [Cryptosporangium arvum]EXG82587.1 putative GTPase, G3E family [Cryptosporangium arvum DSM 44712]